MNKMLVLLMLLVLITACGTMNNQQGMHPFETSDALRDDEGPKTTDVTYQEGEITDIADRNPNFLDLNTENEAHNNHGAYQGKVRQIVESSNSFNPGMIYVNGYKIIVNATPKQKFKKDELNERKNELKRKIEEAVPHYNIDLRISNQE